MPIETKKLQSWEEFEKILEYEGGWKKNKEQESDVRYVSPLLFRGHSRESWKLETTLERFVRGKDVPQEFSWNGYHRILLAARSGINSFTEKSYQMPDEFEQNMTPIPPGYPFMIYLRHHSFPSPLLDWTMSPYIAAFFAFNGASPDENPAIFTFREFMDGTKCVWPGCANVWTLGPYAETHRRHHLQQCQYTICYKEKKDEDSGNDRIYCPHEEADFDGNCRDKLIKYIIPYTERKKVMAKLDAMNINAFSLYGNEEGLAQMLAYKEIEGREGF